MEESVLRAICLAAVVVVVFLVVRLLGAPQNPLMLGMTGLHVANPIGMEVGKSPKR
jgi:hypothetical protein